MAKHETQILIFDFDGTLYHTGGGIHKSVNIVASEKCLPDFDYDLVQSLVGYGLNHMIDRIVELSDPQSRSQWGPIENLRRRFREVYNEIALSESALFPGVMEFLMSWPHQLAIVSNKEEFSLKKMVAGSPLAKLRWTSVYGGDSLSNCKPSPVQIEQTLHDSGLSKDQSIFIGDGFPDLMAAQAAEIEFIGVSFGYVSESELRQLGAKRFIHSFSELSQKIQEVDAAR